MLVDPDVLRAFAGQVQLASTAVADADLGSVAGSGADGLPGSTTQWAAWTIGAHIRGLVGEIAEDVRAMGEAVRGAGDSYEVTDADLAGDFAGLF